MTRILLTGGTGVLGRALTPRLQQAGYAVRVMSRKRRPSTLESGLEWARADLDNGQGLAEAVMGADVILHAATSLSRRTQQVDIDGTRRLAERARSGSVAHFLYFSIVGIDRIPFPYYRHKVAAEAIVAGAGVPWSILRATQFHNLLDGLLQPLARLPISFSPTDFKFQRFNRHYAGDVGAFVAALGSALHASCLRPRGQVQSERCADSSMSCCACRLSRLPPRPLGLALARCPARPASRGRWRR